MGSYRFTRLPSGLTNAPEIFQRSVDIRISGLHKKFRVVYSEDITVYPKSEEDQIRHVNEALSLLEKAALSLKFKKSRLPGSPYHIWAAGSSTETQGRPGRVSVSDNPDAGT